MSFLCAHWYLREWASEVESPSATGRTAHGLGLRGHSFSSSLARSPALPPPHLAISFFGSTSVVVVVAASEFVSEPKSFLPSAQKSFSFSERVCSLSRRRHSVTLASPVAAVFSSVCVRRPPRPGALPSSRGPTWKKLWRRRHPLEAPPRPKASSASASSARSSSSSTSLVNGAPFHSGTYIYFLFLSTLVSGPSAFPPRHHVGRRHASLVAALAHYVAITRRRRVGELCGYQHDRQEYPAGPGRDRV